MPTAHFETTITADRTIRIPDEWDLEPGATVRVTKLTPQPPTDEEADEMMARLKAKVEAVRAGIFESEEEARDYKAFCKALDMLPPIPADFKFDREEAHERR